MFGVTEKNLFGLMRGSPGQRFQHRYHSAHRKGTQPSPVARVLRIILALVALAVGVIFAFIPGPAVVFFALAGALLAPESRRLAVGLDWAELKLRAGLAWAKRTWKKLGWFARSIVILIGTLLATAAGWAVWQRFIG